MGDFPNKATQFSSTNQPEKNGRKKKIYTILKEQGYSADDLKTAFGELPFYNTDDLSKLMKDDKAPVIVRIISHQLVLALKSGDWTKIRDVMEHFIGKAPSSVDVTSGGEKIKQIFKIGDQEIEF